MTLLERRRALMMSIKRKSKNLFNAALVPTYAELINNGDGSFSLKGGTWNRSTRRTLKQLCPDLKVGDIATLSGVSNSYKMIKVGTSAWNFGASKSITQTMLDATVLFYANEKVAENDIITVKNIQIELGTVATEYEPYY